MTSLQQLYEEFDAKFLSHRIIVAGADISELVDNFNYGFDVGQVPTATFNIPADWMVPAIAEEAEVEIWVGFRVGLVEKRVCVFGGGIINSVSFNGGEYIVECVQDGGRRLNFPYYKQISYEFDNVTAQDSVTALLDLAGVTNYLVDLDPWDIGTAVPQTLKFSTYGEAINKVSTVDGSPWFALPTGQIRVEKRDPLPYDNPARRYFGSAMDGIVEVIPPDIFNTDLRPRVLSIQKSLDRPGVNNFITVDGAVLVTLGPNGEQNSEQIVEEVDGAPGSFPNGAPWIPTPPLFQPFTFSDELIDTNAKAFDVAERYYNLQNRLIENVSLTIPLDPLLFLCMTIRIIDEESNTNDLYFLQSYRCSVSDGQASSDLTLRGGPFSGTQGFAKPFAEFVWSYSAFWNKSGGNNEVSAPTGCSDNASKLDTGFQNQMASKLCQDLPENTGSADQGGDKVDAIGTVMIGFDGTPSQDFDGEIQSWDWSDSQGHTGTGSRVTFIYDPTVDSSVQVTLTVTDDTARTDTIIKTVNVGATYTSPEDPTLDDTTAGGGVAAGDCTDGGDPKQLADQPGAKNGMALVYFIAAECKAMATKNNRKYNMLEKDDLGVGSFISVAAISNFDNSEITALYGTDDGHVVKSDDGAQSGTKTLDTGDRDEAIKDITVDPKHCGTVWASTSKGKIFKSDDRGANWKLSLKGDGKPINKMLILNGHMYVFGGDTGDPQSLIRVSTSGDPQGLQPVQIRGNLQQQILTAGEGYSIQSASVNAGGISIGFNGGLSNKVWSNPDPRSGTGSWEGSTGVTGAGVKSMAPGHDDHNLVSTGDGVFKTNNNKDYTQGSATPHEDMKWEGLPGVYVSVDSEGNLTKSTDDGDTEGNLAPNTNFADPVQDAWPPCAVAHQVAVAIIPRDEDGPDAKWPAKSTGTHWVSTGYSSANPTWNAALVETWDQDLVPVSDVTITEIGSLTRKNNLDNQADIVMKYYLVQVTGPTPLYTGGHIEYWFNADGHLPSGSLAYGFSGDAQGQSYFFPVDPYDLDVAATGSLPDNTVAGGVWGADRIPLFNVLSDSFVTWPSFDEIGPQAISSLTHHGHFTVDNSGFSPHANGWLYIAAGTVTIVA